VEGDFIVQVKVTGDYPTTATSVVATRRAFHGAGLVLFQNDNNYVRLERAQLTTEVATPYIIFELRRDGNFERVGTTSDFPEGSAGPYLRLERRDGKVYGSVSQDGTVWHSGEPMDLALPRKARVGIVAGHNTSSGFAPTFSEFKLFRESNK
jgi:regulation of enolase protein 1 (concanavalin A-like superfamily)